MTSSKSLKILSFIMALLMLVMSLPLSAYAKALSEQSSSAKADTDEQSNVAKVEVFVLKEETQLREENVKHFKMSDGTTRAVVYGNAVHYKDANGSWVDIDNALTLNGNEYSAYNKLEIKFANKTGSNGLLSIKDGDYKIDFTPINTNKVTAEIENPQKNNSRKFEDVSALNNLISKAIYKGIYDGIDIEYIVAGNNIKENIIVSKEQNAYSYTFELKLDKLKARLENGAIILSDYDTDNEIYKIPAPYMYDANGEYSTNVAYSLTQESKWKYTFTVTADAKWINSEATLPVTIDPTITNNGSVIDTYVLNGDSGDNSALDSMIIGNFMGSYFDGTAFVKFSALPTIPTNATLLSAEAVFSNIYMDNPNNIDLNVGVYEVTNSWNGSITYADSISYYNSSAVLDSLIINSTGVCRWDITSLYQKWILGSANNNGICIKAINLPSSIDANIRLKANEGTTTYRKPKLELTYRMSCGIDEIQPHITSSAGVAGTGYVNTYSGMLSQALGITTTIDEILPYSLGITYTNGANGVKKWIAGFEESISLVYSEEIANGEAIEDYQYYEYQWMDSDGSIHFFSPYKEINHLGETVYYVISLSGEKSQTNAPSEMYDEDGLGLTLTKNATTGELTISDGKGNRKVFNSLGKLSYIEDIFGNRRIFTYTDGKVTQISLKPYGASEISQILITYNADGKLLTVRNVQTQTRASFVFSAGNLSKIIYQSIRNSTTKTINTANFSYDTDGYLTNATDVNANKSIKYTYTNGKVSAIEEYGVKNNENSLGRKLEITYDIGKTIVKSLGEDYTATTDDICTAYVFDIRSMLVSIYSYDFTTNEIHSTATYEYYNKYESEGVGPKAHNKVKDTSTSSVNSPNLLNNPTFNMGLNGWTVSNGNDITCVAVDGEMYKSVKANLATAQTSIHQTLGLFEGAYTFSAYFNKYNAPVTSKIHMKVFSNSSEVASSTIATQGADTEEALADYWKREELRFNVTTAGTYTIQIIFENNTINNGYFLFDNPMLERSTGASAHSVYGNGEFTPSASSYTNGQLVTGSILEGSSLKISSTVSAAPTVTQTVRLDEEESLDKWIISGWAKAQSSIASANQEDCTATFGIRIECGDYEKLIPFNAHCDNWQFVSASLGDASNFATSDIKISLVYEYNVGDAYFDKITLYNLKNGSSYKYNLAGSVTQQSDKSTGKTIEYEYGANAYDPTQISDGDSSVSIDYDENRAVSNVVNRFASNANISSEYERNAQGQLLSTVTSTIPTYPEIVTTNTYVSSNDTVNYSRIETTTDETGAVTKYFYEDNGLLKGVCTNDDAGTLYDYDAYGKLIKVSLAKYNAESSTLEYASVDTSVSYDYNSKNELEATHTYTTDYGFTYDEFGNMLTVKIGNTEVEASEFTGYILSTYEYEAHNGNVKKVTYGNGTTLYYSYDNLDRVIAMRYNKNGEESIINYGYSASGQLTLAYDSANGTVYNYYYDSTGKILSEKATKGSTELYNKVYSYDEKSRLTNVATYCLEQYSACVSSTNYVYNDDDQVVSVINNNGETINYTYDGFGRIREKTAVYNSFNIVKEYTYKNRINETQTTGQIATEMVYKNNGVIASMIYTYDDRGNITEIKSEADFVISYEYDDKNQLIRENNSKLGYTYLYTYDPSGNLRAKEIRNYTLEATNIITSGAPIAVENYLYNDSSWGDLRTGYISYEIQTGASISGSTTYDGVGNPLSYFNGKQYTFTWENGRQLASTTVGNGTVTYKYNQDGIRVEKIDGNSIYEYTLNGSQITREREVDATSGATLKDTYYYYDANGVISSAKIRNYSSGTVTESSLIFRTNIQGDVVEIFSNGGTSIMSIYYDAWGNFEEVINTTNTDLAQLASQIPFRYRGYYYDNDMDLYYLNSRYYDAKLHRFINADDISYLGANGDLQGFNLYAYCSNNPVMYVDYFGHSIWDVLINMFNNLWESIEAEVGIGIGIGVSSEIMGVETSVNAYRDNTLFFEDGEFVLGNVIEESVEVGNLGFGGTHINYTEGHEDAHAHRMGEGFLDVVEEGINCEKCIHENNFSLNNSASMGKDFVLGASFDVHFILGGHISYGLNVSEFIERIVEDFNK